MVAALAAVVLATDDSRVVQSRRPLNGGTPCSLDCAQRAASLTRCSASCSVRLRSFSRCLSERNSPWPSIPRRWQRRCAFATSDRSAIAWRPSPASPATRTPTTPARRRAESGRRPTPAFTGRRSSTTSPSRPSARWPSRASNPNIVWAGTGEPWIRSHISVGNGVYKSTDAGRTWTHMGLDSSGRIGRIVDRSQQSRHRLRRGAGTQLRTAAGPRICIARPTAERRGSACCSSTQNTGAIDVVMHPTDSKTLFAAMWQLELHTWGRESGGPGSGIYVSRDGGIDVDASFKATDFRRTTIGKIGLAISRSNPNRVYALIETGDGNPLHGRRPTTVSCGARTTAAPTGASSSYDRDLGCRQPYYTRMAVAPDNPDETYFLCATFSHSLNGGATLSAAGRGGGRGRGSGPQPRATPVGFTSPGGDNHDMWIDPDECRSAWRSRTTPAFDLDDARPHVAARPAADRADVSRHGRQPHSLLRLRQQAGRSVVSRAEQQPVRQHDLAQRMARRGRRRERLGHARPGRSEYHLVHGVGLGVARRNRRSLRRAHAAGSERRSLATQHRRVFGRPR